jgi:hypothetical protein
MTPAIVRAIAPELGLDVNGLRDLPSRRGVVWKG